MGDSGGGANSLLGGVIVGLAVINMVNGEVMHGTVGSEIEVDITRLAEAGIKKIKVLIDEEVSDTPKVEDMGKLMDEYEDELKEGK